MLREWFSRYEKNILSTIFRICVHVNCIEPHPLALVLAGSLSEAGSAHTCNPSNPTKHKTIRIWLAILFFTMRTGNCGSNSNSSQLELELELEVYPSPANDLAPRTSAFALVFPSLVPRPSPPFLYCKRSKLEPGTAWERGYVFPKYSFYVPNPRILGTRPVLPM